MARSKGKTTITPRLSAREKGAFFGAVANLADRHPSAHPCPLGATDLVALWKANMSHLDLNFWDAAHAKMQSGDEMPLVKPRSQGVILAFDFGRVLLELPDTVFAEAMSPVWRRYPEITDPVAVVGPEKAAALRAWAQTAIHISARVKMTLEIMQRILDICNTAGQLNRVAPELVKYVDPMTQQAFNEQERRSPPPPGDWLLINRTAVQAALGHLSFCYLLPKADPQPVFSTERPWCWDLTSALHRAGWMSRPETAELAAKLCVYKLADNPNPMELGTFSSLAE